MVVVPDAITTEERTWDLGAPALMSRRQRRDHNGPYRAAIPASLANASDLNLTAETLAMADDASAAIVRFDADAAMILPFSALLLRSESAASSQIENLTASARAIAMAELDASRSPNARIIVANTRAMEAAIALADDLDGQAILDTHAALLGDSAPDIVGAWRSQQVWIGGSRFGPHQADFVPPHHDRVAEAMADLVAFMHHDHFAVLAHVAIAHAQFETIHPFPDGNGRTGRALMHAMLRAKGLTNNITIPVSAGLLAETESYFGALTAFREGDPNPIVAAVATASFVAIENASTLSEELTEIRAGWTTQVSARADAAAWRVADLLLRLPVIDSPTVQHQLDIPAPTALRAIEKLETANVLTETSGYARNRVWQAEQILLALDGFAERAGRRAR